MRSAVSRSIPSLAKRSASIVVAAVALTAIASVPSAGAAELTILHVFGDKKDGDDLSSPMILDDAGNLYGTTTTGGRNGAGAVFRLTPPADGSTAWTESVLFSFNATNGLNQSSTGTTPQSSLWLGDDGSLFGTTSVGSPLGAGNVFQLTPPASGTGAWTETAVYNFQSGVDDAGFPEGLPVPDRESASRFGVTLGGGPSNIGAFYSLTPPTLSGGAWSESMLYAFNGGDGAEPINDLVADAKGNLYGVTLVGGAHQLGAIFRMSPPKQAGGQWTETTLHSFTGGADGRAPDQKLTLDAHGALWGTTASGGSQLLGNIFRLSPPKPDGQTWLFKNMHEFADPAEGQAPHSSLTPDGSGGFYGTTGVGGAAACGTVYRFQPTASAGQQGVLTTLQSFTGGDGGGFPYGGLLLKNGVLYGQAFGSTRADSLACNARSVAFMLVP